MNKIIRRTAYVINLHMVTQQEMEKSGECCNKEWVVTFNQLKMSYRVKSLYMTSIILRRQ